MPTSREHLPQHKLILDEAADFPRGRSRGGNTEKKNKRTMKKLKQVPAEGHRDRRPDRLFRSVSGEMKSKKEKGEKMKKRNRANRIADKKLASQMYPTDENLFNIKQRKRRR